MESTYTTTRNEQFHSIEISFLEKPSEAVRDALKTLRFRWHSVKKVWYGYADEETTRAAIENALNGIKTTAASKTKQEKRNKFGVKVGDLFSASWGYEQTNVDFFQVVALVGESSVRVREVHPKMIDESAVSSMSADRTYCTDTKGELLPPCASSVFIQDQEKGDLKRLKSYAADGKSNPQFYLSSFADAHFCTGSSIKTYESWYY